MDSRTLIIESEHFRVPALHVKCTRNDIELTGGRYSVLDNGDLQIIYPIKELNQQIFYEKNPLFIHSRKRGKFIL